MKGRIKKIINDRGFGFIEAADRKDVFFHCSEVDKDVDFEDLQEGDPVSYEVEKGPKGPRAVKVQKTEEENEE